MVKLQEIVGPINLKLNKQTNKMELIFERSMFSICALTFGFCQFIYIWNMGLITLNWEMKVKTLMLIEYASIAVRYCSTIIGTIANRAFIIGLWNEILDLEIKYKDLNLHCRVYVKVTVILLLTPITLDFIVTSLGTALFTNMTTFFRLMQILCIFLNKSVILIINYKFFTFITMYANYFKQLNQELKNSITDASNCSLAKLKLIAMCHQCLCEHVKRISYYLSFHIILQIGDCMVLLTYHLYVVIAFFLNDQPDGNSLELNQAIFSITVSIFTILVLIIPCELCMLQVMKLDTNINFRYYGFFQFTKNIRINLSKLIFCILLKSTQLINIMVIDS